MKTKIFIWLVFLVCFASYAEVSRDHIEVLKNNISLFEANPTKEKFERSRSIAESLIKECPDDALAYIFLSKLYMKSEGTVFGIVDADKKALETLSQYQGDDDNVKQLRSLLEEKIENWEGYERVQKREKLLEADRDQPVVVLQSRELVLLYGKEEDPKYLDKALELVIKALESDPTNFKLHLALIAIYEQQRDFINAYAAWEMVMHFGGQESYLVQDQTGMLYREALSYEEKYAVSNENPGPDLNLYFLWLHRDTIWKHLSEKGREDTERLQRKIKIIIKRAKEELLSTDNLQ